MSDFKPSDVETAMLAQWHAGKVATTELNVLLRKTQNNTPESYTPRLVAFIAVVLDLKANS